MANTDGGLHFNETPNTDAGRPAAGLLPRLARGLTDLFFPHLCVGCEERPGVTPWFCPRCHASLASPDPEVLERLCPVFRPGVSRVFARWYTEPGGAMRRAIHAVKYRYTPALAAWLGREAAMALGSTTAFVGDREGAGPPKRESEAVPHDMPWDALVAIPLHRIRMRERGFNQSELIANGVKGHTGLPVESWLRRRSPDRSQTRVSSTARRRLSSRVFLAEAGCAGRRILLVDDIATTGSTLNAAATAMLDAGAVRVDALTVAVARRPGSP